MGKPDPELLDAVYRHYPRGLAPEDPAHAAAPETLRLREAQERARADRARLIALMEAVEAEVPGVQAMDLSYLAYDAGYTVRFNADPVGEGTTRWREVVACISILAPVYLLYQSRIEVDAAGRQASTVTYAPDPDVAPLWDAAGRAVERIFGHAPLAADAGLAVLPDVQVQNVPPGEATLYDALFTPSRE